MKKALGVIPARLGSSRFPAKPLAKLFGKTMIEHTFQAASCSKLLDRVIVASDSDLVLQVIRNIAKEHNTMLTGECKTGTDRVVQVLDQLPLKEMDQFDVVVNIQGDEPGVNPVHIDLCIEALRADSQCVMSTLATPIHSEKEALSTDVVKCIADHQDNAIYFSRGLIPHSKSGQYDPQVTYLRHAGLYVFRKQFLCREYRHLPPSGLETAEDLEQLRVLSAGLKIKLVQVSDNVLLGVDTRQDLERLEKLWRRA